MTSASHRMTISAKATIKSASVLGFTTLFALVGFQAAFGYGGGGGGGSSYVSPYVRVTSPNGSQSMKVGDPYQIQWSAGGTSVTGVSIYLSTDGGSSYPTVVASGIMNVGYYYWNVPDVNTTTAKIKVQTVGSVASDTSDAVFTIVGTSAPVVTPVVVVTPATVTTTVTPPVLTETETDTPTKKDDIKKREAAAPASDPHVTGKFVPASVAAYTPTINVDKGLKAPVELVTKCEAGMLIKGSLPSVYFCGNDGRRYVFVSQSAFRSWYKDFSSVQTISDADLALIPLGGNVTYKPGARLIKLATDPKVYAIARGGILRWVQTEAIAEALYGANWSKLVDDVADTFFVDYRVGEPVIQ